MTEPTISVIIPCHNMARFVVRTMRSVAAQTGPSWEMIIVDDGSTDDSPAMVLREAGADSRIRLIRQPNRGVSGARNAGFRTASSASRYLLFLDADDCLHPHMLETLFRELEAHSETAMAFCDFRLIDEADSPLTVVERHGPDSRFIPAGLGVRRLPRGEPRTPFEAIFGLAIIIPSITLIRRSAFEAAGGWDEQFGHVFEDTDLFLRLALRGEARFVPEVLVDHRRHGANSTGNVDKVNSQCRKLYSKWLNRVDLTPDQRRLVRESWRFVGGRLAAFHGFTAGWRAFRRGNLYSASRFWAGALRRYAFSLVGLTPPFPVAIG